MVASITVVAAAGNNSCGVVGATIFSNLYAYGFCRSRGGGDGVWRVHAKPECGYRSEFGAGSSVAGM